MKILFLSQSFIDLKQQGIYSDLINALRVKNHEITVVSAVSGKNDNSISQNGVKTYFAKVGNQYGVNFIKKGLVLLSIEFALIQCVKRFLLKAKFDLILYATPPVTMSSAVKYCKRKFGAKTYLMLKDIFPQNAVDLGILSKTGVKGLIYRFYRRKEIELYRISDRIGCMSAKNIAYLKQNNTFVSNKLEIFPNAFRLRPVVKNTDRSILKEYGVPYDKIIFLYGGNLGKPQGLGFLTNAIHKCQNIPDVFFLIAGKGGEKQNFFNNLKDVKNVRCINNLESEKFGKLCAVCDIGLASLDYRFTIPNFPSRILSYMEQAKPIFAVTDSETDVKNMIEEAHCGKWCPSNDTAEFVKQVNWFVDHKNRIAELGANGRKFYEENFTVTICVDILERFVETKGDKNV